MSNSMFLNLFTNKPVVIAEAGVNHNGNFELACKMVEAAAEAGADIIKFQTFKAHECASRFALLADYQKESAKTNQFDLLESLELPFEKFRQLKSCAEKNKIMFLSTPDGIESLEFLVDMGVKAIKIASGEVTNLPFLEAIAKKKLPLLLSTGMSKLGEIEKAITTLRKHNQQELILMHCTSQYPAIADQTNLNCLTTIKQAFNLDTGFSDHTEGLEASIAATALGACVIEKHFTLDRKMSGPDHLASIDPGQLKAFVLSLKKTHTMLGSPVKQAVACEKQNKELVRRSVVATRDIAAGETILLDSITTKRPGNGIPPELIPNIYGRRVLVDIKEDQPISWQHLGKVVEVDS